MVTNVIGNDTDVDRSNQLSINAGIATILSARRDSDGRPVPLLSASIRHDEQNITFNPGSDFNDLFIGESATVTVRYTVTDNDTISPYSDDATLTITVLGTRVPDAVPARAAVGSMDVGPWMDLPDSEVAAELQPLQGDLVDAVIQGWMG